MDRAWAVLIVDLDWPPYYLRRFDARTRGCEPLAYAVKGVNGFNLAARQIDFGDPAEGPGRGRAVVTTSRARRRLAARPYRYARRRLPLSLVTTTSEADPYGLMSLP